MSRVLGSHACSIHKKLVDLEGTVLNLLFCFLCFGEDGSGLGVVVAVHRFEVGGGVFVALMNDPVHVEESRVLVKLCLECPQVAIDMCDALRLEYLYVEDTFDIDVAFNLTKGCERLADLSLGAIYVFLDVQVFVLYFLLVEVASDHYSLVDLAVDFPLLPH